MSVVRVPTLPKLGVDILSQYTQKDLPNDNVYKHVYAHQDTSKVKNLVETSQKKRV